MSEIEPIVDAVARASTEVAATLPSVRTDRDSAGGDERNPTGDDQTLADRRLDECFCEALTGLDAVGAYASEERAAVLDCGDGYGVAIDPLDGSSNLPANGPVGTVLGVYDAPLPARGTDLVGSALVVFGPWTSLFVAADGSVTRYRIEDGAAVDPLPVSLPDGDARDDWICGYSGRRGDLSPAVRDRLDALLAERTLRYSGAAVADVQALLHAGGVLCYPRTDAESDGVLRLQYEANPIAHLVETAGGRASDGTGRLRERSPDGLHERVPVIVGAAADVERLEAAIESA